MDLGMELFTDCFFVQPVSVKRMKMMTAFLNFFFQKLLMEKRALRDGD